jgi:hypothetical protein
VRAFARSVYAAYYALHAPVRIMSTQNRKSITDLRNIIMTQYLDERGGQLEMVC